MYITISKQKKLIGPYEKYKICLSQHAINWPLALVIYLVLDDRFVYEDCLDLDHLDLIV